MKEPLGGWMVENPASPHSEQKLILPLTPTLPTLPFAARQQGALSTSKKSFD